MHYIKNLETDKINIISTRAEYKNLPDEQRNFIKSYCRFNGSVWASKAKISSAWNLLSKFKEWNIPCQGEEGTKLSFVEQIERKQEKAELRTVKMEARLDKCQQLSEHYYGVAKHLSSFIPMGQPILVGHHSERGHRNHIKKIDNNMRKSCEADDKAAYYDRRLAAATVTAEGKQYKSVAYLGNRIKESEAHMRTYERRLQGKIYHYSEPEPISERETNYWKERQAQEQEKLDFYNYCLKQCVDDGVKVFNKETLKDKKEVLIGRRWESIVKLNKTTVAIPNICFPEPEHQIKYALKYGYHEIKDAR